MTPEPTVLVSRRFRRGRSQSCAVEIRRDLMADTYTVTAPGYPAAVRSEHPTPDAAKEEAARLARELERDGWTREGAVSLVPTLDGKPVFPPARKEAEK